jgi:hypothetical protein
MAPLNRLPPGGWGAAVSAGGGGIILTDGKPPSLPTDDRTAVRVRALKADRVGASAEGEILLALEITPEPKLLWQETVAVQIKKATDDQGQDLEQVVAGGKGPILPGAGGMGGGGGGVGAFRPGMMAPGGPGGGGGGPGAFPPPAIPVDGGRGALGPGPPGGAFPPPAIPVDGGRGALGPGPPGMVVPGGGAALGLPAGGMGMAGNAGVVLAPVRLKKGAKPATSLKEVSGTITARVLVGGSVKAIDVPFTLKGVPLP